MTDVSEQMMCAACKEPIEDDDYITNRKEGKDRAASYLHGSCNRLKARVQRMRAGNPGRFESWSAIPDDQRVAFYKKCSDIFGDKLCKAMDEVNTTTHTRRSTVSFKESGEYLCEKEARELPQFANDEEAWNNLLQNTDKFQCPTTKIVMLYVPNYKFKKKDDDVNEEANSRTITRSSTIKAKAKAKPKAKPTDGQGSEVEAPVREMAISPASMKRIGNMLQSLQETSLQISQFSLIITSEEAKPYVTAAAINKATGCQPTLSTIVGVLSGLVEKKSAAKGAVQDALKESKSILGEAQGIVMQIEGDPHEKNTAATITPTTTTITPVWTGSRVLGSRTSPHL